MNITKSLLSTSKFIINSQSIKYLPLFNPQLCNSIKICSNRFTSISNFKFS